MSVNKIYQVEINNETSTHRYRQECNGVRESIYHITVECNQWVLNVSSWITHPGQQRWRLPRLVPYTRPPPTWGNHLAEFTLTWVLISAST